MIYSAFISYSHAADGKVAPALQSALHKFAKPWYKLRAMRVFRDETNLAVNPQLWSNIVEALDDSEFFILLASPQAAQSNWVPKEVDHWLSKRPPETLLIVLTDGEIVWDQAAGDFDWTKTTALPRNLGKVFSEEPLYLDFRSMRTQADLSLRNPDFLSKIARVSATIQGRSLDELIGEDVQQHRKFKLFTRSMTTALAGLLIAALATAWYANVQRNVAEERNKIALSRQLAAQARSHLDDKPDLALLLSVEASRPYPTIEAQDSLLAALLHYPYLVSFLHGHTRALRNVFSPDGKTLASASADKTIRLWDVATRQPLGQPLTGHTNVVFSVAFSPDGKTLASAGGDKSIRVWDVEIGAWKVLACRIANRNLSAEEWRQYIGNNERPQKTCPQTK